MNQENKDNTQEYEILHQRIDDEAKLRQVGDEAERKYSSTVYQSVDTVSNSLATEVVDRSAGDLLSQEQYEALRRNALEKWSKLFNDIQLTDDKLSYSINLNAMAIENTNKDLYEIKVGFVEALLDMDVKHKALLIEYDVRLKKYENMLSDITADSHQITADNNHIPLSNWTILSRARMWDLAIIETLNKALDGFEKKIDDNNQSIIDQLPDYDGWIEDAINDLSNAQVIKDLDEKLNSNIEDINNLHKELIDKSQEAQNAIIASAAASATALEEESRLRKEEIDKLAQENIDAIEREADIRQAAIINEAKERSKEIDERIKEIEAGVDTDLTEVYNKIDAANNRIESVKTDLDKEREERLKAISKLDDGLTQEIQHRKEGDESITKAVENYKASNEEALANIRTEIEVAVNANETTAKRVDVLDVTLKKTNEELGRTTETAATALEMSKTNATETSALVQRVTQTEASIKVVEKGLESKADSSVVELVESRVDVIDGQLTAQSVKITKMESDIQTIEGELDKKVNATVLDAYSTTVETNKAIADRITQYDASLQIGGTNLAYGTDSDGFVAYSNYSTVHFYPEQPTRMARVDYKNNPIMGATTHNDLKKTTLVKGRTYTLSFIGQGTMSTLNYCYIMKSSGNKAIPPIALGAGHTIKRSVTFTWIEDTANDCGILLALNGAKEGDWFSFRGLMLEEASKPSMWSPNPYETQEYLDINAKAITSIKAEVSNLDGKVTSNSNSITALENSIKQVNNDLKTKASAKSVTDLTSRVEVTEKSISSISTDVTKLNNQVEQINKDLSTMATSEAMRALDSRVTVNEGKITSQGSDIVKLRNDLTQTNKDLQTKASAQSVSALDNRVTQSEKELKTQSTQLTELKNDVSVTTETADTAALLAKYQGEGKPLLLDPDFRRGSSIALYGTGNGTLTRKSKQSNNPSSSPFEMVRQLVSSAASSNYGYYPQVGNTTPNQVMLLKHVLCVPKGWFIAARTNATGGGSHEIVGDAQGTGVYSIYYSLVRAGNEGTFGSSGHIVFKPNTGTAQPTAAAPVDFFIASCEVWDVTKFDDTALLLGNQINAQSEALESLDSKVTIQDGKITSQGTKLVSLEQEIEKTNKAVSSKAESSTVQTLESKVTEQDGVIKQQGSAITKIDGRLTTVEGDLSKKADASVLVNYSTTIQMNKAIADGLTKYDAELVIGGTNLAYGTNNDSYIPYLSSNADSTVKFFDNKPTRLCRVDYKNKGWMGAAIPRDYRKTQLIKGKTYTLSFLGQGTMPTLNYCHILIDDATNVSLPTITLGAGGNIKRSITFEWTADTTNSAGILLATGGVKAGDWFTFMGLMLEESTKPSMWTPNPYEVEEFMNATATVANLNTARVEKTEEGINTLTQSLNKTNSRIEDVNKDVQTKASNSALQGVQSDLKKTNQDVANQATAITKLQTDLATTNSTVSKKADAEALRLTDAKVANIDGRVTAQASDILTLKADVKQNKDAIATKADVTALNAYYTKAQTDSAIATANTKLAASLIVGGSNMLYGTHQKDCFAVWNSGRARLSTYSTKGNKNAGYISPYWNQVTALADGTDAIGLFTIDKYKLTVLARGKTYTITWRGQGTIKTMDYIYLVTPSGSDNIRLPAMQLTNLGGQSLNTCTFTLDAPVVSCGVLIASSQYTESGQWFRVADVTLNEGSIATTWSMNSNETSSILSGQATAIEETKAQVNKLDNGMESSVSKVTALEATNALPYNLALNTMFPALSMSTMGVNANKRAYDLVRNGTAIYNESPSIFKNLSIRYKWEVKGYDKAADVTGKFRVHFSSAWVSTGEITVSPSNLSGMHNATISIAKWASSLADSIWIRTDNLPTGMYIEVSELMVVHGPNTKEWSPNNYDIGNNANNLVPDNLLIPVAPFESIGTDYLRSSMPLKQEEVFKKDGLYTLRVKCTFEHNGVLSTTNGLRFYFNEANLFGSVNQTIKQCKEQYFTFTYKVGDNSVGDKQTALAMYVWPNGTAKADTRVVIHSVEVFRGDSPVSDLATASYVASVETKVTETDGKVVSLTTDMTSIKNEVRDPNTGLKATNTQTQLNSSEITKTNNSIAATNVSLNKVSSSLSDLERDTSIMDTRSVNSPPIYYWDNYAKRSVKEFKTATVIGLNATEMGALVTMTTDTQWHDISGGSIKRTVLSNDGTLTAYSYSQGTGSDKSKYTWSAWSQPIKALKATTDAQAVAINSLTTDIKNVDGRVTAVSRTVTQLQADVDGHSAKLQVQGEVVDGLKASYVIKTDVDGLVAGYGLYNDGKTSAFGVNADFFYVGKGKQKRKMFIATTANTTVGGVTYPPGVWIDVATIANATIGTAHIADLAVTNAKIANLAVDNAKIKDLNGDKITANSITGNKIKAKEIKAEHLEVNKVSGMFAEFGEFKSKDPVSKVETTLNGNGLRVQAPNGVYVVEIGWF